ncbi:MAG: hypothetical protein ACE5K2_02010 [Candidatus Zixiibacteriota bacterium]
MRTLIKGEIEDFVPFFNGLVDEDGIFSLQEDGEFSLTVDTGFSGGIALIEEILEKMDVDLIDYGIFRLATGVEFLSLAGSRLSFDFDKEEVELLE